ncbi:hypothetical protein BH10ACT8_BH10ACT8_18510 [soil metagenome]
MHRSLKFTLYGLVLAGLVGGAASWASAGKSVDIRVDGHDQRVHTQASSVQAILAAAHLSVGGHDLVAPDLQSQVGDGGKIIVRRGHLLHLKINGQSKDVWVNADSVDEALSQLGYSRGEYVSVSRSQRLDSGATSLAIDTPKRVIFAVDGKKIVVMTAGPTVYQAIEDAGLYLAPQDRISASGTIRNGQLITIRRVTYRRSAASETVPFSTVKQPDPTNYVGTDTVVQAGKDGQSNVTYQLIYVDGKYSGRVQLSSVPGTAPVQQILKVGSKPAPAFVAAVPAGTAQQIAAGMVAARGWGSDQFSCLVSLWSKESGWRTNAANPSGAYGIPQALPGSKMASAGADWQTSAATQITWGLGYISGVYGTPCAAWAHSQATNWY